LMTSTTSFAVIVSSEVKRTISFSCPPLIMRRAVASPSSARRVNAISPSAGRATVVLSGYQFRKTGKASVYTPSRMDVYVRPDLPWLVILGLV
jgi:hypothetical protein